MWGILNIIYNRRPGICFIMIPVADFDMDEAVDTVDAVVDDIVVAVGVDIVVVVVVADKGTSGRVTVVAQSAV